MCAGRNLRGKRYKAHGRYGVPAKRNRGDSVVVRALLPPGELDQVIRLSFDGSLHAGKADSINRHAIGLIIFFAVICQRARELVRKLLRLAFIKIPGCQECSHDYHDCTQRFLIQALGQLSTI